MPSLNKRSLKYHLVNRTDPTQANILINIIRNAFGSKFEQMKQAYIDSLTVKCDKSFIYIVSYADDANLKQGFATFELIFTDDASTIPEVRSLGILPEYQSMGLGTQILDDIIDSYDNICINYADNDARGFYNKYHQNHRIHFLS